MKLHGFKKPARAGAWCGPSAIAIVTGCGYERANELAKIATGKRAVMGLSRPALRKVLERLGCVVQQDDYPSKPTLAAWLRGRTEHQRKTLCIVNAGNHYVVVLGRKAHDNGPWTGPEPVFTGEMKGRRARVKAVIEVTPPSVEAKRQRHAEVDARIRQRKHEAVLERECFA